MNYKAGLAFVARKTASVRMRRRRGIEGRIGPPSRGSKVRRRLAFVSWAMAAQLLKGAAFAGGRFLVQILLARFLGD